MIRLNLIVLIITGLFSLNSAQLVQFGTCDPNIPLVENFNATRFLGTWYAIARTDNIQQNGDCAVLTLTQANNFIEVKNEAVNSNFYEEFNGRATLQQGTAKFSLNMTSLQNPIDFWILITDYENFAVGYACENRGTSQRNVYIWQLGRATRYPTEMMEALVNTTITNLLGINTADLRRIDHSENACYVLPEIPANQAIILPGQCNPNMIVVQNFNASRFGGTWHEISRYYTENEGGTCNRAQYTLADGGVNVLNSQVIDRKLQTISGRAVVSSTDGTAKLTVSLEISPNNFSSSELWIIGTDYENYAISYSCVNLANNQRRVYSWILSRTRQLTGAAQNAVNGWISTEVDLNTRFYLPNDQSDEGCFYFPDPVFDRPTVFRGQCDMNIPTVQNFDAVRYVGLWHDIESYPSSFQQGTCNNALYTLGSGNVLVYNTQVINQTLDTMNGVAVLASTDASAKLQVTFPVAGTNLNITTDYWVLATDYTSYSLVYTCTNINNDEREVYAWKLSRTKQLPVAGNTAINAIVNNINVLDQRYFLTRDQSPSACFYFPEPQENTPVVFPGQCDDSVATVNNFNMQQFEGIWYEVEAYPKEQQTGQCILHNYTSGSTNTLNLQSSSVTDQLMGITNGVLTFNSSNNSGRLNIRMQTSSGEINIPFWILSVDYNDYALAYSCVNDGSDFRKVFSWKLSRTKQLSSAANTAINSVIDNNIVLHNNYYRNIDQSNRACFYLPDIPPGEPIILPGQCDPNITVVQNFNVSRYSGRWRLIDSYPAEAQTGTCNDATYTLSSGAVNVFNTQVINQTLDTVTGTAQLASTDGSAKLLVTFPGNPVPADYWVLDTDYDSYALVYGCRNINTQQQRVFSWKLSRKRDLTADAINKINQVINNVDVLNNRFYEIVDQSDDGCFYYPEPSDGPVIFRGQCQTNVTVVTGFDAARYMNKWHDIESYPTPFQEGTCPNAFYQIVGGVVDVFNTQVINQSLDTIRGQATLQNSNDGSAKLIVTFPVNGSNTNITSDYWVLATDYTSYALVYSCLNIDEETRQVTSWKLSRTKALTQQAVANINTVVNTVPVLDQRYYKTRDQSASGCFYYPEPQPGVPVIFPGQCDNSISVVPNFNLSRFQGNWYEIQAYPKEQQTGQCINHQYTFNSTTNTLNLRSTNVLNEDLRTSAGVVNSSDSSGRLIITLTEGNQRIEIPFWILSTDYDNYALAYSCVNRGPDNRAVFSWMLSRSKQLNAAANTAINNAIANVDVLDQRYYERIDQSDLACFYLPELVAGQPVVFPGQCDPNIAVVRNFNAARYLGRWRMIETYHSDFQSGACNEANYALLPNSTVDVVNTQVVNQLLQVDNGNAVVASTDGSAKLLVTFPNAPEPSEYWVLGTDYDNYALVYSCKNIDNQQRRVWSWKLSRDRQLSANASSSINQIVNGINVLNSRYYQPVVHSDAACFYYPPPSPGTPVVFRGQCDLNIPVVTNFDLTRYLGQWHDIESYPTTFQDGTCGNALYSLNGNVVDVFNTQVVQERLDTITGIATLTADPNNSAKIVVRFPVAGSNLTTTTDYWVLSTDYSSYSLVYSCRNLNAENRQVSSWKLSRTKQLSPSAVTAINNVVNTVPVLDAQYYQVMDQSRAGCFYYPEPQPGVPVVFPGQCDENIQAIPNFNLTQFLGTWHEIQAYPKDEQLGQCINHQYSLSSGNIMNLLSSNVQSQALFTSNSVATINSTDSSGRLLITLTQGNNQIEIPFWILNTDYNDYALAYSCVNRGQDYRAIYSWKLSRTKQLSTTANNAINNAIANITVLDNVYYENIDQSDSACFYLPNLSPGEPVEFPGQCDNNIPVVRNFDPVRYAGRWRLIETYEADFQSGSCNEATYTLSNGSVIVYNTQVVNQTLDTITGSAVLATSDGSGKLLVTFPTTSAPSEYWVLGTDYDNYALVYSCKNIDNQRRRVWSWKLSRDRQLSANASSSINQIVNGINVLNSRYYQPVVHSDAACFYYPPPSPGTPVVFRGQCDLNIPVVTNFDLTRYLGQWHDIESYPTAFQDGTCGNALYSLNGNVVDVFNTQVVQERLDTITGVATLSADPNNSAKIVVNFPIAGTNLTTTADYWVLSTDYSSYSLVYSCRNLDAENREVSSWKLSRTKQLSPSAVTAINNVVNTVPVLDAQYYQVMDQSRAGCFYYPEPQPGVPVVFPGQCDENIQAIPNFNLTQFLGTWHEIQAYPKDEQLGQCINHQYSLSSGNIMNLLSSNVQSQALFTSNSVATINSTDSSGKLLITLTQGNNQIEIPFWILNTDYNDYALAYSCVNRGQDYRAIYSWKLSRTKQLSTAANNAINNTIANITVLDNVYYENIDQSDSACFYLPNLSPGEPVEFPGQCDNNIPVVRNFDPVRYAGRWRLIETYEADFQSGSCNEATYTLSNGSVIVYNTQVVNQILDTITGSAVLATSDGSGKLLVTFPTSPEPAEYWIIDTDYDSYAFVYSCQNINYERRRVWSWKLSRTRELAANATANINRIIDGINVLNNRYYQRIEHSESSCFYYPIPDSNTPVEFRGQCNENINVVQRFDLEAYMGVWYDIEGYPQGFQSGSCATANYKLTAAGVEVLNTQVVDQRLDVMTAVALPASTDGSAKFTVTFPIAGTNDTVSTPYWVLSTDYTSFALVYSCSNINNERYRVTSWKLSRQQSLSAASNQAISAVMANVPVLRQQYYVERGHTVEDCRFYPENNGGPVILDGECEEQAAVTGFNADAFRGTWYETARFPAEIQTGQCAANTFTTSGQSTFNVAQTFVERERMVTIAATATASADGRGVLNVTLTSSTGGPSATTVNILATDYTSYALLHSCKNLGNQKKQIYSWKLSRSKSGLSQVANEVINAVVRNTTDLFEDYYDSSDQSDAACFYYPVFDQLPATITLTGRCNDTVRAKPNFSAANFAGKWIEISRYPQTSQVGQCNRPEYVLRNGSVEVINTQVINSTLDVVIGSAIVSSTDGSGILQVTFTLPGGVVNVATLYILETDYSNFALAYSCRNLPDGNNRQVFSWKLSRTTSLSNAANNAINTVISNTQGLLNEYYLTTDQSEEACFYVPEVNTNAAPVFRGQCENITGVQGFNIQRYLGWWHEIERYPSDEAVGVCISSDFRASGNQYQVIDTNVFGISAEINTSTVTATNNGRLRRTLSNGQVIDIWVLDTDYETYSLLYSCENINNEYRRVWSAKHSKVRQLSQAAQNAMAPVIANNRVLYQQFYQTVDQSDSACFHYREQTGNQIILSGQCDLNIPVVQNFDPTQYTGTWYQIERYPQEHESGNCTGARYSLDEATGIVDVLNWEVINGVLDTIEGTATVNSTDGSAKLIVRLPDRSTNHTTATVEMRLYVLSTDYVSYSLAYSCVNINQFQRSVGAWKLSRTRTMPAAGTTAINTYMGTREELHQPYFVQVEQSDECEEPNSAVLVKSSIIVMLVCVALQMFK